MIVSMMNKLASDRAENSIMQAVAISVSAILIAAGIVFAPAYINSASEISVRTNLTVIGTAQESYIAQKGAYADNLLSLRDSFMGSNIDVNTCLGEPGPEDALIANCKTINIIMGNSLLDGGCYVVFATTPQESVFYIQSKGTTVGMSPLEIPMPWPSSPTALKPGKTIDDPDPYLTSFAFDFDSSCMPTGLWPVSLEEAMTF